MKFDSIQDLLHASLSYNYRTYPVVLAIAESLENKEPPNFQITKQEMIVLKYELQKFFTYLELLSSETGGIDLDQRVLH